MKRPRKPSPPSPPLLPQEEHQALFRSHFPLLSEVLSSDADLVALLSRRLQQKLFSTPDLAVLTNTLEKWINLYLHSFQSVIEIQHLLDKADPHAPLPAASAERIRAILSRFPEISQSTPYITALQQKAPDQ